MQVAQTILKQLGGNRFLAMTGAKNLLGRKDGLSFKVGHNAKRITHVRVSLTPSDLYTVEFIFARGSTIKTISTCEDVYAEDLRGVFTNETGLYTSFGG